MNKLAIVVTYFNCFEYTKAMVESIRTYYPYYLILVDDYSWDGSKAWARELAKTNENVILIEDPDTISLGQKWNMGVEKAKELGCEVVLTCNNDILFAPDTIDNIMKRWEQGGASIVSAHNIRGELANPQDILIYKPKEPTSEAPHPDFSCFLMEIKAWEMIGRFPEVYIPCYFEDNHIHTMLKALNLLAISTTTAPYYHYGSITQNQVDKGLCSSPMFEANRDKFVEIFGALPEDINLEFIRKKLGIVPVS